MEIKINKEIRQYTESVFFGLSLRQCIFSALACGSAVAVYFIFKPILNTTIVSWLCMAVAVPFVLLGFVKYNGMTAEKFFWAWVKSEILIPKRLTFKPQNYYLNLYKQNQKIKEKDNKKLKFKILKSKKK